MMRRLALLLGLITGLIVLASWSQSAGAQAVERIRIADPARQAHGLPAGLTVDLAPPSDSVAVNGVIGSTWNRGQALLALSGVSLQGNLPPKIVAARSFARGRFVRGKVVDRFLDAVIGARVSLERLAGGSWTKVAG